MTADDCERLLRAYPAQWRNRYGDEMTALLEDTYGTAGEVPWRQRMSLAWSGLGERARSAGLLGRSAAPEVRLRAGSVLVLCGWAFYVGAGAVFAKFADRWSVQSARTGHSVATGGFDVVAVGGAIGCLIVLLAAALVLPAFVRFLRAGRWHEVRRRVVVAIASGVLAVGLLVLLAQRAHGMSAPGRNGGNAWYSALFLLVGLLVFACIGCATAAAVAVARRVELSRALQRLLAAIAVALVGVMAVIEVSLATWWATEAAYSPGFLAQTVGNGAPYASSTVPPTLLASAVAMGAGLALGVLGLFRIMGSGRRALA